ncbi:MAG: vWA domain-containing protein [Anaerolineae bacterium]
MIHNEKITMLVGCTKPDLCDDTKKMPASGNLFVEAPRQGQLERMIDDEYGRELADSGLAEFNMTQLMPTGLELVPDSADPVPEIEDVDGQIQLSWNWADEAATGAHTVTYQVKPLEEGVWEIGGEMRFLDVSDLGRTLLLPAQPITVSGICEPEVTPPTPTFTPEPATATFTPKPPTATDIPPSPTPLPAPIFIPITLKERCLPDERLGDIALVIDMSSSMDRLTADGVPKKQAVVDAAKLFVGSLDFTPNSLDQNDQVAVIGFNQTAWIQQSLTNDAVAVEASLEALEQRMDHGTRLDLAFQVGAEALSSDLRKASNTPVIILLTDGMPNLVPPDPDTGSVEDTVIAAADAAKDAGITIYTIGFGNPDESADPEDRVNAELLEQCASRPSNAYIDPRADRLMEIYREIADVFTCPTGRHDWSQPWP